MSAWRITAWLLGALIAVSLAIIIVGFRNATAEPQVRRLDLHVADYPAGAAPIRVLLFSDLHVHGPDMPPARVSRIVDQINSLHPDVILAAGDYVGNVWLGAEYPAAEAVAPLQRLRAKYGVFAVLGNNDFDEQYRSDKVREALQRAGVHVLVNQVASVGPLAIAGRDGRIQIAPAQQRLIRNSTFDVLARTPGVKLLLVHRPDELVYTPRFIHLVLAGHTHCGQIVLPLVGALLTGSDYGPRYLCGVIRQGSKLMIVTAGLGTSKVPLRFGAPPDMWLITVEGPGSATAR